MTTSSSEATSAAIPAVLEMRGVTKVYRRRSQQLFGRAEEIAALSDVSVAVRPDETLAVIGDSGSGKTTLTRILLGLIPPSSGEVFFRGGPLSSRSVRQSLRADSGVIFQNPASSFDPRWSIGTSIGEPLRLQHPEMDHHSRLEEVRNSLKAVDLDPDTYIGRYPSDLSGGQMQRAAFARAVVNHPAVLLADEPMSAIDMPTRLMVLDMLERPHETAASSGRQMATIIVSHDLGVVQHIADRVLVVHEGRLVESGSTEQVLNHPSCEYTEHLIAAASL
jgi:peptide/nickel transport system ATP-binding protein